MPFVNAFTLEMQVKALLGESTGVTTPRAPEDILQFLARLRLLQDVPFNTLVPDTELLPNESIRFFFLDRAWTDALVQGALSVATTNSIERAELEEIYPKLEGDVDNMEKQIRAPGGEPLLSGTAGLVTGFLMRSAAVAGWPGMHVRAFTTERPETEDELVGEDDRTRVKVLRMERLSPSVLLVLFDGLPAAIQIEEPRQGLQFGVNRVKKPGNRVSAWVPARDVETAKYVRENGTEATTSNQAARLDVKYRPGSAGVLDLTNTAKEFLANTDTNMATNAGGQVDGAEFAMQMIRFPYRQVFAHSTTEDRDFGAVFTPALADRPRIAKAYTAELRKTIERL